MLPVRFDQSFDKVPFPASGLTVKMIADIGHKGDYHLVIAMLKVDEQLGLTEESVPCSLAVTLEGSGNLPTTKQITSIKRYAEFGFGRIQYYKSFDWHLGRGEYGVSITTLKDCPVAISRGATVSIEQSVTHITERYLAVLLSYWCGVVLLSVGLLGLVFCEFRSSKQ